ncbi:DUF4389 domain-containing protein [Georgenia satyanarayanai]|uniref:DUF4389 domain-containing protein n=1 Tax=Georgenia satyanarayanai TaxID=860221 RepID=UPI0012643676|nr:DUF4389 domain-containing protein [Georgenia satyanarayanai]
MPTAVVGGRSAYPVHVDAQPAPDDPSRWLWLVKWVLIIPHVLVLAVLWAAFVVLSLVALVTIVATGRYPRAIFDFNVGVLRWSWRVAYYSYGALGTDQYPPFSLDEHPEYPAHLDVVYPERLSRGLVLVKWWLLVLPHYAVLVLIVGIGAQAARQIEGPYWIWEGGLIALLGFFAGLALLFTGMYPRGLYDLLLGLNRWVLRVAAYAGLMTDAYPPFRLDQGGPERMTLSGGPPPPDDSPATRTTSTPTHPQSLPPRSSWTPGRVVAVVAGSLTALLGVLGVVGGVSLIVWQTSREDGYVMAPAWEVGTAGYAAVSDEVVLEGSWLDEGLGRVRLDVVGDGEVFVGIATARDAAAYLEGVARAEQSRGMADRELDGGPPAVLPAEAGIWIASATDTGPVELDVAPQPGRYVAVVMDAAGSAGVDATVRAGATLPWLGPAAAATLAGGLVLGAAGVVVIVLAVRAAGRAGQPRGG